MKNLNENFERQDLGNTPYLDDPDTDREYTEENILESIENYKAQIENLKGALMSVQSGSEEYLWSGPYSLDDTIPKFGPGNYLFKHIPTQKGFYIGKGDVGRVGKHVRVFRGGGKVIEHANSSTHTGAAKRMADIDPNPDNWCIYVKKCVSDSHALESETKFGTYFPTVANNIQMLGK